MAEQTVQSLSQIFPSTNPSQNAMQDNTRRTTHESILYEHNSLEYTSEDVVIHCPKCDTYVKVEALRGHRAYHKALETLEWTNRSPPQNLPGLIEQRNVVLSRLKDELFKKVVKHRNAHAPHTTQATSVKDSSTEVLSRIEELNKAFEYLKNDIDPLACSLTSLSSAGNGSKHRKLEMEIDKRCNMSFTSSLPCVYGVGMCSTQNKAYRRDMEDAAVFKDCVLTDDESSVNVSYFAVFDGYHGSTAASVASEHLHGFLKDAIIMRLADNALAQPTIDNYREASCLRDSKDEQTQQDRDDYIQNDNKKNLTYISAESCSQYSAKEIPEKCRERTAPESIDIERKQPKYLDVDLVHYYLGQKDATSKNQRSQLLDSEEQRPDTNLKDLNRLHLEKNERLKDTHNTNKNNNSNCRNKEVQKLETPETLPKSQTGNNTIDECIPEGCVPNQTECIPEGSIPNRRKSKEIDHSASMSAAFKMAYQRTDVILSYGVGETSRVRWSGCSAATLLIESAAQREEQYKSQDSPYQRQFSNDRLSQCNFPVSSSCERSTMLNPEEVIGRLYVANVGNVQAFLVKGNRAYRVTKKHTPQNKQEKERILQQGGFFTQSRNESLVNGVLKTTRGLGNHGDEKMRRCVLPAPSIYCTDIEQQSQLLIIASAGVWDVLSGQEAASLLVQLLPMNRLPVPSRVSTSLMQLFTNRLSAGISHSPNDDNGTVKNQPLQCLWTGTTSQQNSETREQKDITNSATNGQHSLKDFNFPTKSGSRNEVDGKSEFVGGFSGVESGVLTKNSLDNSDIPGYSQGVIPQSEMRRHFGQVMSRYLVQAAMLAGSKQNITAMVVLLPGSGL